MASRSLQPSEQEIQREVEALRDIRRRSINPGALAIDPDLPPSQSPPSPSQTDGSSIPRRRSSRRSAGSSDDPTVPTDDPFHLFWVPASLHPEIAPAEFRAFLKEHARTPPHDEEEGVFRSNSVSSYASASALARRKSMLSRQYQPSENDDVEEERIVPLKRSPSNGFGPQLTIKDLEKLDQLAEEASTSDDPSKFRNILRRSLSLNLSPTAALSNIEEMPDMADEADSPIIVPPPGQILRRAARTKIRKPSLLGDGGGHRFASTRKVQARAATTSLLEPRSSSDRSSSDHGESVESVSAPPEHVATSRDKLTLRPESYGEEAFIIDSYARDDDEDSQPPNIDIIPPEGAAQDSIVSPPLLSTSPPPLPVSDVSTATREAMLFTPQPQPPAPEPAQVPLPISPPIEVSTLSAPRIEPPPVPIHAPVPRPPPQPAPQVPAVPGPQRKEKDKKGGLFKWGGDKASKKAQKNASSEKESGFFGSLFGSKKKQESEPVGSATARETAQALLGSSKSSKNYVPSTSPGLPPGTSPNNYSRYPIHVERAIYRLSHIKLANPRRPLYEQVLISNLMFWYLGVINKAQSPTQPNGQPVPNPDQANVGTALANDAEKQEGDQKERERAEMERLERERLEREQRERAEREAEMKKKETGRRGSLTKPPPGGGRRAEKPVKGPQYEMQHRVMEQEYGSYAAQAQQNVQLARIHSAPVGAANSGPGEQQYPWGSSSTPQLVQPQPQSVMPNQFYNPDLPPSNRTAHSAPPRITSPPDRRSKSPPAAPSSHRPMNASRYSPNSSQENLAITPNGRLSGRSLSATALPSAPMYPVNGRSRKGASIPSQGQGKRSLSNERRVEEKGFEEEDVPLAVWQQQRRR